MAIQIPIDEVYLPGEIESGMVVPVAGRWSTSRVDLDSGHAQVNQNWAHPKRRYELSVGPGTDDIFEAVRTMLLGRRGLRGFLLRDYSDFRVTDGLIGVGDSVIRNFPLIKVYGDSTNPYVRPITRPVQSSVVVKVNNVVAGFTWLNRSTVRMNSAPPSGSDVTATFIFDVPVAQVEEIIPMSLITTELGVIETFALEEVRDS